MSVNSGKGDFSTSFTPKEPLCNGRWHTITGELINVLLSGRRPHNADMMMSRPCAPSGEEEQRPAAQRGRGQRAQRRP